MGWVLCGWEWLDYAVPFLYLFFPFLASLWLVFVSICQFLVISRFFIVFGMLLFVFLRGWVSIILNQSFLSWEMH